MTENCNCDMARSEPLDHKPGPHHLSTCPRSVAEHDCIGDDNIGCPACKAEGAPERISWTLGGLH